MSDQNPARQLPVRPDLDQLKHQAKDWLQNIRRGDKQSSGSQFFIMLRSDAKLDGNYTVIGRVTQGIEALEAIASMTVDTNDCPTRRYEIKSLRLVPGSSPELRPEKQGKIKTTDTGEKGKIGRFFERLW